MTDTVSRILNMKKEEQPLAVMSAVYFFCILCGYFFLRPVRDAMGVARGMDELRWLFVWTALVSLVVVLAFGGVVSRTNRRRFIPIGYLFVIGCLIVFSGMLIADGAAGGGLIGTDTETPVARYVGYVFYVWLSTINLFVNSVFWAFMVDIFDVRQGKRMFAFIGIGGTLGAIAGGWATNVISGMTDSVYLPAGLMLIGAAFFGLAIVVMLSLDRLVFGSQRSQLTADGVAIEGRQRAGDRDVAGEGGVGGAFWEGAQAVVRSPYLLGIGAYIALMAISNTPYLLHAGQHHPRRQRHVQRAGSRLRPTRCLRPGRHALRPDFCDHTGNQAYRCGLDACHFAGRGHARLRGSLGLGNLRCHGGFSGGASRYSVCNFQARAGDLVQRRLTV